MKKLFQLLALASFGLALGSCDKSEPINNGIQGGNLAEPQAFELSSSLASVGLEPLSSNTNKASNELRATLHFHGSNAAATTTLKAEDFGAGKREARWGVVYDGGKFHAVNCEEAVSVKPTTSPAKNTVFFKETTTGNTIQNAGIKMYCRSLLTLKNITKGFMVLEGNGGVGGDITKQYFKGATDPNHRIEGLLTNNFQDNRHIPIMTKVEDFSEMIKPLGSNNVKFAPRGSLIGLNVKNKTGANIVITHILVQKSGALDYSGYFDWSNVVDNKAKFTAEYTSAPTVTALSFPVYANNTTTDVGYTIVNDNADMPCFYIWGFQNPNKLGTAFQVKFRYKTAGGAEETTRAFNVHAPNSKLVAGTKQFDDGYSYNTVLTINSSNDIGGGTGDDWGDGGNLGNDDNSVSLNFETPLDFVAEAPAINKAGTGFVKNHDLPHTNVIDDIYPHEVGYYQYWDAEALFDGSRPFLAKYYFPNADQWHSIGNPAIPKYGFASTVTPVHFDKHYSHKDAVEEHVQIGETAPQDYTSDYITVLEDGVFVTYALRFKGTYWVSAWRYSYVRGYMVIKCVPLRNKPGVILEHIHNANFFKTNPCTIRIFPPYSCREANMGPTIYREFGFVGQFYALTPPSKALGDLFLFDRDVIDNASCSKTNCVPVRPFRRP